MLYGGCGRHGIVVSRSGSIRRLWGRLLIRLLLVRLLLGRRLAYFFKLIANFAAGIFEFTDAFAKATRQLRNLVGTKENENHDHDEHNLTTAEVTEK